MDNISATEGFISGFVGGITGIIVGHPFDTIKVYSQLGLTKSSSPITVGKEIYAAEKLPGLYKGILSPLVGAAVLNSLLFGCNGICQQYQSESMRNSTTGQIFGGMFAGFVQSFVACPTELVKTRIQEKEISKMSPLRVALNICKHGGVKSLFKGLVPTLIRDTPGFAVYFGSYKMLLSLFDDPDAKSAYGLFMITFLGGLAGTLSWIPCFPVDTVKTKIQSAEYKGNPKIIPACRQIYARHGIRGFFNGFTACVIRSFPVSAFTFLGSSVAITLLEFQSNRSNLEKL